MKSKTYQVALIDDDREFAELICAYYEPRKINFRHFESPDVFLAEARSYAEDKFPYDLVMTDLLMPVMNGIDFTKSLKSIHPETPVIVMTADSSVDAAIKATEVGAMDYIIKPPNFPHLTVVLQRTLHFAQLQKENERLKRTIDDVVGWSQEVVAKSPALLKSIDLAKRVAPSEATVLITGESGTGKEVIAHLIHRSSHRSKKPFIAMNCSSIPETLLESELFGHVKGSFTGADSIRVGIFEEAAGGTLFLDEIGDMPLVLQAKILRVLQERKIKRVGENIEREVDVRIIAATLKNLSDEVEQKRFREDLFYRLNVIPLRLPSLKERKEDILPLAQHFMERYATRYKKNVKSFTRESVEWLLTNPWRGNVRELENTIERAVVIAEGETLALDDLRLEPLMNESQTPPAENVDVEQLLQAYHSDLPKAGQQEEASVELPQQDKPASQPLKRKWNADAAAPMTLAELELSYIKEVLENCDGVKDRAAKVLGIDRKTLYRKLQPSSESPQNLQ